MFRSSILAVAGFVLFGVSFAVLLQNEPMLTSTAVAITAWLAGLLAIPLPSGVAVREVVLLSLLSDNRGTEMVLGAAVVHRWVSVVADMATLMLLGLVGRARVHRRHSDREPS